MPAPTTGAGIARRTIRQRRAGSRTPRSGTAGHRCVGQEPLVTDPVAREEQAVGAVGTDTGGRPASPPVTGQRHAAAHDHATQEPLGQHVVASHAGGGRVPPQLGPIRVGSSVAP